MAASVFTKIYVVLFLAHIKGFLANAFIQIQPLLTIAKEGDNIIINCTITNAISIYWDVPKDRPISVRRLSQTVLQLEIQNIGYDDSYEGGNSSSYKFTCKGESQQGGIMIAVQKHPMIKVFRSYPNILVEQRNKTFQCGSNQLFQCGTGVCIFKRYRCDLVPDCPDESDEYHCGPDVCKGKFRCRSGRCINKCDQLHDADCKDETNCGDTVYYINNPDAATPIPDTHPVGGFDHSEFSTIKTTVYGVVGSVVGLVVLGAILVVVVCSMKMKQKAARRLSIARGASHPHTHRGRAPRPIWQRSTPHYQHPDVEPYELHRCPASTNVTTNFNVADVDNQALTESLLVKPPEYVEVAPEEPPPPYSTIDRNKPPRPATGPGASNAQTGPSNEQAELERVRQLLELSAIRNILSTSNSNNNRGGHSNRQNASSGRESTRNTRSRGLFRPIRSGRAAASSHTNTTAPSNGSHDINREELNEIRRHNREMIRQYLSSTTSANRGPSGRHCRHGRNNRRSLHEAAARAADRSNNGQSNRERPLSMV
ncbi:unnamed protein product [Owenia fusiformis]|uniref:Uncharacterized protein n=1 Tax=Owenia fusiformis TaxID=6347 RepID=A0A8S4P0R4_OWEFU|nr:unnamed protein product [Owenia fusiformis]